jgi:hypothetical protein
VLLSSVLISPFCKALQWPRKKVLLGVEWDKAASGGLMLLVGGGITFVGWLAGWISLWAVILAMVGFFMMIDGLQASAHRRLAL